MAPEKAEIIVFVFFQFIIYLTSNYSAPNVYNPMGGCKVNVGWFCQFSQMQTYFWGERILIEKMCL